SLYVSGFRSMTIVFIILTLAWSIGEITSELGTADYLVEFAQNTTSPIIIPALLFLFGSVIAFTTGTSYGTFAIMIPIAMPLAFSMDMSMTMTIAAVLSGGILETTVLLFPIPLYCLQQVQGATTLTMSIRKFLTLLLLEYVVSLLL